MPHTLEDVLIDLVMNGADRAALVRPAQEGKPAAVCIIMESEEAIAELGVELQKILAELGSTSLKDFNEPFSTTTPLSSLFEIADRAPCGWSYGQAKFGVFDPMVMLISREVERVAAVCTEHGAPCSLDPEKAAPNHTIARRIQR